MPGGRPTKYNEEIVQAAEDYLINYKEEGHAIPSVIGMGMVLNLSKSTLYDWADQEDNKFSAILAKCMDYQHHALINGGLKSDLNSNIVKLALGKHGYSDKLEQDTVHSFDLSGHTLEQLDEIINSEKS